METDGRAEVGSKVGGKHNNMGWQLAVGIDGS